MSYENAPGTALVATRCVICHRPLLDAESVQAAMGPDCRKTYGVPNSLPTEARNEANKLINWLARCGEDIAVTYGHLVILDAIHRLRQLGLGLLSSRLADEWAGVVIVETRHPLTQEPALAVRTRYIAESVGAWRSIPGRYWDASTKTNVIPVRSRAQLHTLLLNWHEAEYGIGPKGAFILTYKED